MKNQEVGILLVEDDEVDVMNVQRAFQKNKIVNPLFVAENGADAIAMLRGSETMERVTPTPKIVLLDINMPKMNGLEFLKEIRNDPELRALSVFILTTSNEDQDRLTAYNLNVAGYILKPVGLENFMSAIADLQLYWQLIEFP